MIVNLLLHDTSSSEYVYETLSCSFDIELLLLEYLLLPCVKYFNDDELCVLVIECLLLLNTDSSEIKDDE